MFESSEINNLYGRLPEMVQNAILRSVSMSKNAHLDSQIEWNNKILAISIDNKVLKNIGVQLNGMILLNKYDSMVNSFIERALLRLSFEKSIPDIVNTAETMQIRIFFQNKNLIFAPIESFDELINIINASGSFTLTKEDYFLVAEWKDNGRDISLAFPNNYQLITGKNKIELDEELCKKIGAIVTHTSLVDATEEKVISQDSLPILVVKGSRFMDLLSSDVFYKLAGKDSILIFEEGLIPFSVTNLFLNKGLAGTRSIQLNYKLYGEKSRTFNLNLHDFINLFENDFQCFVGMEKSSQDSIEGTVVFCHKYFNYINLLHFKTNSTEFFSTTGNIHADFYANIPMHNVSNLFKEYLPEKSEHKIDVNTKNPN